MKVYRLSTFITLLALLAFNAFAQDKADAITAFNAGLEQAQAKQYDSAISSFTTAMTIAEGLGTDGEDIKTRSQKQIPKLYFSKAVSSFNDFKSSKSLEDLDNTVDMFMESEQVAKEYGDDEIAAKSKGVLPQLFYQKSILLYNREDYTGANAALDRAIESDENYAVAYYQKGLVYKKINADDLEGILNWYDKAIDIGGKTRKSKVVREAKGSAHDELLYRGSKAVEAKSYTEGIELLNKALTYDDTSADAYYRLAEASNKKSDYDSAVKYATKSLEFEKGGRTDKAKIYFELGIAYQGINNIAEACKALTNASYGSFKAPAEHKMEHELKCKTTSPSN